MKKLLFTLLLITLASNAMDNIPHQEHKETKVKKGKVFLSSITPHYAGFPDDSRYKDPRMELSQALGYEIQPSESLFTIWAYDEACDDWSSEERYPHDKKNFLDQLPWQLIKDVKEGEEFTFKFFGMAITLQAQQRGSRYGGEKSFEEMRAFLLERFKKAPNYENCREAGLIEAEILQKTDAGITHGPKGFDFSQLSNNNN